MSQYRTIKTSLDERGVFRVTLDREGASANLMDERFAEDLACCVEELSGSDAKGVIITSAKGTFFAGGDLDALYQTTHAQAERLFEMCESIKRSLRRLETRGVPVVACLEGAALGGGWELALACHYRLMRDERGVVVGLPEVTLGLLPGGGGVARTVRMFGLQAALPLLTEGRRYDAHQALKLGLIHEIVSAEGDMEARALALIEAHPAARQPWDETGFRLPGGAPTSPKVAPMLAVAPAMLHQKTKGVFPAPKAILCAMVEGAQVDFETACRIESRYFVELVCGQVSKNMINTFWYQLNETKAGVGRPQGVPKRTVKRVGVLGAGMMGAGVTYVAARRGLEVVLKDVSVERAEEGKGYSARLLDKRVSRGQSSVEERGATLALIKTTADAEDLKGCELVVEAVFEDRELKARVTQEAEQMLAPDALFASNTSTLPITGLASASTRPERFIGLHFFSPVDKMSLVEIICGAQTSPESLAMAYDFVLQLGKTPIVVKDSRGFFTSRVFGTFTYEGIAMVAEGISPALIERAAALAGFPVGPLAVSDEVSLTLMERIRQQTKADLEAEGQPAPEHAAEGVIDAMLELKRAGRAAGAGFYEYPQGGGKQLWAGLGERFPTQASQPSLSEVKDRLLYIMAIESARCMEEGVLTSARDANLGSIFGIGFPPWTGGVHQFIQHVGREPFIERARELSERYGERFTPPDSLQS